MNEAKNLHKALAKDSAANAQWKSLTPIARRDFLSWIGSAKQEETRARRVEKACSMLAKGKRRPCCYDVVPLGLYNAVNADPTLKARWKKLSPDERRDLADEFRKENRP